MRRPLATATLAVAFLLTTLLSPLRAGAAVEPRYCFRAHVAGIGWQAWECHTAREYATNRIGTTGQNRAIEAVQAQAYGFRICLQAHVRNLGWGSRVCTSGRTPTVGVGTTGQGRPMEALTLTVLGETTTTTSRTISAVGHVQNIGWILPWPDMAKTVTVGTTGRALNLECVMIALY